MIERTVMIQNTLGLHARASACFVAEASHYPCYIGMKRDGIEVNGKSIMGVMMLAAAKGSEIILIANGEQEAEAIDALATLIDRRFGEDD